MQQYQNLTVRFYLWNCNPGKIKNNDYKNKYKKKCENKFRNTEMYSVV